MNTLSNEKKNFVNELGKVLNIAKPHLIKTEYKLGEELLTRDGYYQEPIVPEDEFVVVTCDNGYKYNINVTANSLSSIAQEVFNQMSYK